MDAKVTVSVRSVLIAGLVLLGLLVAYLLGAAGGTGTPATAADEGAAASSGDERTMMMSATGEASAVPDQLSFNLSVSVTRPDLDQALAEANRTMRKVFASLEPFGVEKADVQTTGLSMNPVYEYHDYSPPTITGYQVSQKARVTVGDLHQGGKAITAAVNAGGNSVRASNIQLEVSDPDAVLSAARDAAVQEATAKAKEYAAATGQSLGDVVSLREVSPASPRPSYYSSMDALSATKFQRAVPIRAGQDELKVTVAIVWAFG